MSAGVPNQKQEPHTKMWVKRCVTKLYVKDGV